MITEPKKRDIALVGDDSPETLRLLTDALDGAGMTVMVAMDGAAAMRIVEQITPDIILLDAVMPGMDGFETCQRLKRDAGLSNVPVIFDHNRLGHVIHAARFEAAHDMFGL